MNRILDWLAIMALVVSTAFAQTSLEESQQQTPTLLRDLAGKGNVLALRQLKALANNGNVEAAFQLSILYLAGHGVPNDPAQSVTWCRKAAEGGHAEAQANLGTSYQLGSGVPKDLALATSWFRKAAEQGNVHGQQSLGVAFQKGSGVPKDLVSAYMWMDLAARQGPKFATQGPAESASGYIRYLAKTARDELAMQMSPSQITEAKRRSRDWRAKPSLTGLP
jgi:TPR repeat protein